MCISSWNIIATSNCKWTVISSGLSVVNILYWQLIIGNLYINNCGYIYLRLMILSTIFAMLSKAKQLMFCQSHILAWIIQYNQTSIAQRYLVHTFTACQNKLCTQWRNKYTFKHSAQLRTFDLGNWGCLFLKLQRCGSGEMVFGNTIDCPLM